MAKRKNKTMDLHSILENFMFEDMNKEVQEITNGFKFSSVKIQILKDLKKGQEIIEHSLKSAKGFPAKELVKNLDDIEDIQKGFVTLEFKINNKFAAVEFPIIESSIKEYNVRLDGETKVFKVKGKFDVKKFLEALTSLVKKNEE